MKAARKHVGEIDPWPDVPTSLPKVVRDIACQQPSEQKRQFYPTVEDKTYLKYSLFQNELEKLTYTWSY